jgi:hypothetical protein
MLVRSSAAVQLLQSMTAKEHTILVGLFVGGFILGFAIGFLVMRGIPLPPPLGAISGWLLASGFFGMGMLGAFMLATLVIPKVVS